MNEDFRMEQGYKEAAYGDSLGRYTAKTFGWMFIGLLITFGVAIGMYMTDGLYYHCTEKINPGCKDTSHRSS